jgi:hypothetical protein
VTALTNFLHWRKTCVVVLWSAYVPTWAVITGSGLAIVTLWWLVGMIVFSALWLGTQPLFQQGRGFNGVFSRRGWSDWRVVNLHRTHRATEPRRDAG